MHRKQLVLVSLFAMSAAAGCATSRGIVDVKIPNANDPVGDRYVRIAEIHDARTFELSPSKPSTPSLKNGEINDKTITARAIARKRNTYGMALGDILLPEGRTVVDVVRDVVTRAFRESGYSVVDSAAPEADALPTVSIEIEQFWAWMTPGMWTVALEYEGVLDIKGNVPPFEEGQSIRGYAELHSGAPGTSAWTNTFNKGLEDLVTQIKARITSAESSAAPATPE